MRGQLSILSRILKIIHYHELAGMIIYSSLRFLRLTNNDLQGVISMQQNDLE